MATQNNLYCKMIWWRAFFPFKWYFRNESDRATISKLEPDTNWAGIDNIDIPLSRLYVWLSHDKNVYCRGHK